MYLKACHCKAQPAIKRVMDPNISRIMRHTSCTEDRAFELMLEHNDDVDLILRLHDESLKKGSVEPSPKTQNELFASYRRTMAEVSRQQRKHNELNIDDVRAQIALDPQTPNFIPKGK